MVKIHWIRGYKLLTESANQISGKRFKSTTIFKGNVGLRESNPAAFIPKIEEGRKLDRLIAEMNELRNSSTKSATIFKVNVGLRESTPAAYTPMLVSIGPYHNRSLKLRSMEKYKLLYLKLFLSRKEGIDIDSCMRELDELKDKALMCYDDGQNLGKDIMSKFTEIMLLDGCFLVEFIRERFERPKEEKHYQRVIDKKWMRFQVRRDIVVLENQLPFFVLTKLYDMTKRPNEESFLYMVARTLRNVSPKKTCIPKSEIDKLDAKQFDHLLHVVHTVSCPLINSRQHMDASKKKGFRNINLFLGKILQVMKRSKENPNIHRSSEMINSSQGMDTDASMQNEFCNKMKRSKEIPDNLNSEQYLHFSSVTELHEAGVSFKKIGIGSKKNDYTDKITLLDIKFDKGLLEIPYFAVESTSETFLRNLIAFEQHSDKVKPYFLNYAHIMDQLISSPKDVQLLRESGIILNDIGDDKAVANIFNKLGVGMTADPNDFYYYKEECRKLIQHCQKPWNKWRAILMHNYFPNPWAGASTVAAIALLMLTAMQTIRDFTDGGVK